MDFETSTRKSRAQRPLISFDFSRRITRPTNYSLVASRSEIAANRFANDRKNRSPTRGQHERENSAGIFPLATRAAAVTSRSFKFTRAADSSAKNDAPSRQEDVTLPVAIATFRSPYLTDRFARVYSTFLQSNRRCIAWKSRPVPPTIGWRAVSSVWLMNNAVNWYLSTRTSGDFHELTVWHCYWSPM